MSILEQHSIVSYYAERTQDWVDLTTALANLESPTNSKEHVDKVADFVQARLTALGASVERMPRAEVGDILLAKWNADRPGKPILILMHMDTVWGVGTVPQRPVHVEGDRLIGPGTWDMKGSIAQVLTVIEGLRARNAFPDRPIWAMFTSDEETGSIHSWDAIEETAKQAGLCLVMEFAATNNGLKTWRKGIAHYTVKVTGKSSHAGNAPEKGINAVLELAHQTIRISELQRMDQGTSVSVTVVNGGTATNVIPANAQAQIDVRFTKRAEAERVASALKELSPVIAGAQLELLGHMSRPPMERDEVMIRSYEQAQRIAGSLGFELPEEGSGGGSDGNITAALGVPTLDGLGVQGEGAHAAHEQCVISSFPRRAALLDAMLREWSFEA
jgi:glutamate carboxypeptidase